MLSNEIKRLKMKKKSSLKIWKKKNPEIRHLPTNHPWALSQHYQYQYFFFFFFFFFFEKWYDYLESKTRILKNIDINVNILYVCIDNSRFFFSKNWISQNWPFFKYKVVQIFCGQYHLLGRQFWASLNDWAKQFRGLGQMSTQFTC